jgi:hypothetical protein
MHRIKVLYSTVREGQTHIVSSIDWAEPEAWQHGTPCCDEPLLDADVRENWDEVRSAWDDDDDHPDTDPELRVMSEEEFLMESAQDRHYPALGEQVYK